MLRLYSSLLTLALLFSGAAALFPAGAYSGSWGCYIAGAVVLIAFIGLGGVLVPPARKAIGPGDAKGAAAALQAFGAFCAFEFLLMALMLWIYGNRSLSDNSGYQVVGLLIFLALVGVGIQGAAATLIRMLAVRNHEAIERRAAEPRPAAQPSH